jgi:XTP/dITP diphosphohydrolase
MALYFVTGNAGKFREMSVLLAGFELQQLELDLDEIQSLDSQAVIEHKLAQAAKHQAGEFIVDDTAIILDCLGSLPGPLMKWFIKGIGLAGIADLTTRYDTQAATARTTLGYRTPDNHNHYVTGEIRGRIVPPRGDRGHGWDPIFVPEGYNETFAELGPGVKNRISMRAAAAKQLSSLLKQP